MTNQKKIDLAKKRLADELAKLEEDERNVNARKKFLCGCGKMHSFKECEVIQTHHYVSPRGCTDGDYWVTGELKIICPKTHLRNRAYFNINTVVDWRMRDHYDCNLEKQFIFKYKNLFKKIIDDYNEDEGKWVNNLYFEENAEKFGLEIKYP